MKLLLEEETRADSGAPAISQARLPTNTTTKNHAIHRWFNFIAGFSPEFVDQCISTEMPDQPMTLLDPFAGCGTALVQGRKRGLRVIGFEPHPIFARVARAKTSIPPLAERERIANVLIQGIRSPARSAPQEGKPLEFLSKLFAIDTLHRLEGARNALQDAQLFHDDLAFLILSRVLELTSHSQTDGIYKAPTSRKRPMTPEIALQTIVSMIEEDVAHTDTATSLTAELYENSSEQMTKVANESIDRIVTSPPYLNNFDYAEMTRMHLYFWGIASNWSEISTTVRSKLIINTTTALKGHKERQQEYRSSLPENLVADLDQLVRRLSSVRVGKAGKKEYDYLVYPYFSQMQRVLSECLRVLRPSGEFHMMVADAALYGIHVSAPQILSRIMLELGYRKVNCTQVRKRGDRWILEKRDGSPIGLGEYHISAYK